MPHGTWFLWVGRNRAQLSGEAGSSPGFTGNPLVSMPRASDSGDPGHASPNGVPDTAFRAANGVGIAMRSISELNPHGLLTHCVRFAPASHPANGNTRYRPARYGFDRAGLAPAGLQQEVSLTHRSSPSSALIPARSQIDPLPTVADRRSGRSNTPGNETGIQTVDSTSTGLSIRSPGAGIAEASAHSATSAACFRPKPLRWRVRFTGSA